MFETLADELALIRRGAALRDRVALAEIHARLHLRAGLRARLGVAVPMGAVRRRDVEIDGVGSLTLRSNDVVVFEVLGCGAYGVDLSLLDGVETVLDLGANVGLATIDLARRLPRARFACVEASPDSFALLRENLRRNVPGAQALNAVVAAAPGRWRVDEGDHPGVTTVQPDPAGALEGRTVTDILDWAGFERADLVKVDIQGGEAALFDVAGDWAGRVGAIIAEIHAPMSVDAAAATLARQGYRRLPLPGGRLFDDLLFVRQL